MTEKIRVSSVHDIPQGKAKTFKLGTTSVAIFNQSGKFFAIEDACSHAGAPLSEGTLQGNIITCPWHGATFDITTGNALSDPASENVPSFKVICEENELYIEK